MLIIFDLDDTLIDTSGSITPFKMKECLQKLMEVGLVVQDFNTAYAELLSYNASSMKSKDALLEFLRSQNAEEELLSKALPMLTTPLPNDFSIKLTPNAKEILKYFASSHRLALVTGGHPPFQLEKMEKAGIDRAYFSKIAIPEDSIKGPFYKALIEEFGMHPSEVYVCGDRVAMDLLPAYELGLNTIHMRWGRGLVGKTEEWVHHAISDLTELKRIISL